MQKMKKKIFYPRALICFKALTFTNENYSSFKQQKLLLQRKKIHSLNCQQMAFSFWLLFKKAPRPLQSRVANLPQFFLLAEHGKFTDKAHFFTDNLTKITVILIETKTINI